jgi:hypothetical protein
MRSHGERNYDIDLVSLLLLGDAPTSARLKRDRTAYSKVHARIRISEGASEAGAISRCKSGPGKA